MTIMTEQATQCDMHVDANTQYRQLPRCQLAQHVDSLCINSGILFLQLIEAPICLVKPESV